MSAILKQQSETMSFQKSFLESRLASLDCLLSNMELEESHRRVYETTRGKVSKDLKQLVSDRKTLMEKIKIVQEEERKSEEIKKRQEEEERRAKKRQEEEERRAREKAEEEAREAELKARQAELEAKKKAEEDARIARELAEQKLKEAKEQALDEMKKKQERLEREKEKLEHRKNYWFEVAIWIILFVMSGFNPVFLGLCVIGLVIRKRKASAVVLGLTTGQIIPVVLFVGFSILLFVKSRERLRNINLDTEYTL